MSDELALDEVVKLTREWCAKYDDGATFADDAVARVQWYFECHGHADRDVITRQIMDAAENASYRCEVSFDHSGEGCRHVIGTVRIGSVRRLLTLLDAKRVPRWMRVAFVSQVNECDEGDVGFCVQIPWHDSTAGIWSVEHLDQHEAQCAKYAADCKALDDLLAEEQARQLEAGVQLTPTQVDQLAHELWFADFYYRG